MCERKCSLGDVVSIEMIFAWIRVENLSNRVLYIEQRILILSLVFRVIIWNDGLKIILSLIPKLIPEYGTQIDNDRKLFVIKLSVELHKAEYIRHTLHEMF